MTISLNPERERWAALTQRCTTDDDAINLTVAGILKDIKEGGDKVLTDTIRRIEGFVPRQLLLPDDRRRGLIARVAPQVKAAIDVARENIRRFHAAQLNGDTDLEVMPGVRCMQRRVPIQRVGLYIPGGKAPLFSTVLMLAVPARVAGCPEVILCTPCDRNGDIAPEIAYAATACGIDKIYTVGGAQAIAAMAYGTESIPKVDKIFGPGNRYVTKAKQMVAMKDTAIDMPAGPSEVMVLADASANPAFVAADFLSQAEHGDDSQAVLVCNSEELARNVGYEIERQKAALPRLGIVDRALSNSRIVVFTGQDAVDNIVAFANAYAAEHLIIQMADAAGIAARITAAGSVFIGAFSPESAGDYASGTNHTLPTGGWATAFSGVNTDSFMRRITYQQLTREGLALLADTIVTMAQAEGLDAHANAVKVRMQEGGEL